MSRAGTSGARRTVAITGAASGIGRAAALGFLRGGWRVVGLDRDGAGLERLAAEAARRGAPESALTVAALDVTDAAAWRAALAGALGDTPGPARPAEAGAPATGRLDALVQCAGLLVPGRFVDVAPERHRAVIDVNVTGTANGALAAHPYLARTPGSVLVNLASAAAIYGQPELASYAASKFAVRGLTEALDLEWAADGIDVVALWPLYVRTPMLDGVDIGTTRRLGVRLTPDRVAREIWRVVTIGRYRRATHRRVGLQAKALAAADRLAPPAVARTAARWLAGAGGG